MMDMRKLFISLAVLGTSFPVFCAESVNWEIKQNLVTGGGAFPTSASGRQIFADFNNDGILDYFIIAGQSEAKIGLFVGNADGTYTEVTDKSKDLYAKSNSSALFIDINNNGNLDLITVGKDGGEPFTDVFMNSGAPDYKFSLDFDLLDAFPGLSSENNDNGSKILVGFDYNNDGWTDLLINGSAGGIWEEAVGGNGQGRVVAILKNNKGKFELVKNPVDGIENFQGVNGGSIDVADFNQNGWMDIIVSGYEDNLKSITKLYRNNGNGTFSEIKNVGFIGHQQGETAFVDVNNDGYPDIIEIGRDVNDGWKAFGKLFINNQNETFTRIDEETTNFFGGGCALSIGDINNDGLIDFFMSGWNTNSTFMYNNGNNVFTKTTLTPDAARCRGGASVLFDQNKNGFLDLSIFGYRDGGGTPPGGDGLGSWPNYILLNKGSQGISANAAPTVPTNVTATYNSTKQCYEIRWDKSTDDTTPTNAIRYNVYVKTSDGKINVMCPADIKTGALKMVGTQYPLLQKNSYDLYIPQTANIEVGVQAIDNGWSTSLFVKAGATGINNTLDQLSYLVYASEKAIHVINHSQKNAIVRIMNMNGQVLSIQSCDASQSITFDNVEGLHFVEVRIDDQQAVSKILVF